MTTLFRPRYIVPTLLVGLAGIAWLAFGYFGIHTAFIDDRVAEAAPEFDAPSAVVVDAPSADTSTPADVPADAAEPVVEASGEFGGTSRYDVSGDAIVLGNGTGQRFLRFEDFDSDNGPDLNVYLVNPDDPSDFVDLGDLKGNIGNQNYEIPEDADLDRYRQVSIWCVRFGVGFGTAELMPTI